MLKTVVLLNIFVETVILMNRKINKNVKRTTFILNSKFCEFFLNVFTVTSVQNIQMNASLLNKSINFLNKIFLTPTPLMYNQI